MADAAAARKKDDDYVAKVDEKPAAGTAASKPAPARVKRKPYSVTRVKNIVIEAGKKGPAKLQPFIHIVAWLVAVAGLIFNLTLPTLKILFKILQRIHKILKPFHPEYLLEAVAGLFCCFYGGSFLLLVASAEAWRAASWEQNKHDLKIIYEDMVKVNEANQKDALKDEDGNGIADVDELDATRYFLRKVNLVLVSVDPEKLSDALNHLYMAFIAIVAALRVRFARAVALGNSLGDIASGPAKKFIAPVIRFVLPQDYKRWAGPTVGFIVKFAAIQVAWTLQRVISTVHSAVRGGFMFSRGILSYLRKEGKIKLEDDDTYVDEVVGIALAIGGFYFQTSMGWKLPFPVNLCLLPATIVETFLSYYVASK